MLRRRANVHASSVTIAARKAFNHARMKRYLIICAAAASAVVGAASPPAESQGLQAKQAAVVAPKPVSTREFPQAQQEAPPRHLSDAERAELRRQLRQFNREYVGKHSS
jgi:hypothetical protein